MERQDRTVEQQIAAIATPRKGIVTWGELREAGISEMEIRRRAANGLLIREYRGVYRVGHRAPSTEASYLAAVRACGSGAYLCGLAGGYHQGLLPTRNPPPPEVMCPTERRVAGIQTKRARSMHHLGVAEYRGIPVTTVPRTLLDLAAVLDEDELARACHEAWIKHRTGLPHVQAVLDRHPNAKGAAKLRRLVGGEAKVTLSRLESGFLSVLRDDGVELPETNRRVGTKYVDCRWPGRLTVELDSYAFHNTRHAWEQHHDRRREARARNEEFRSYTWWDINEGRNETATEVRSLLAGR